VGHGVGGHLPRKTRRNKLSLVYIIVVCRPLIILSVEISLTLFSRFTHRNVFRRRKNIIC